MAAGAPGEKDERLRPTALEIACGTMLGRDPEAPPLPDVDPSVTPRAALEQVIGPALERRPCLVTLSGGRDSSAVLAVAVHVARREGLPLPVPITVRFKEAPGTSEPDWQELVVEHLRLDDWIVLDVDDELDLVGPIATRVLLRHGVLHPSHACLFALILEHARGGSLLTGMAGDTMFGSWPYWRLIDVLALRRRPGARELLAAGQALAPAPIRRIAAGARAPRRPWLTSEGKRLLLEKIAEEAARAPRSFRGHVAVRRRARSLMATLATIRLLGEGEDVVALDPLCEPLFVAALARAGGRTGLGSRTAIMRALFGDILPEALVSRSDKARFPFAYFRAPSRKFARSWSGNGLDPELVDPDRLREAWLELLPNGYSALALQQAWLASHGERVEEQLPGLVEEVETAGPA